MSNQFQPSSACFNLVKQFEGLRLEAYMDSGGVPTIGWGHTAHVSIGPPPDLIGEDQAEAFLAADLADSARFVSGCVTVELTQNQFDALVSFCFNEGAAHLAHSTLLYMLNMGDYAGAADQFSYWVYARNEKNQMVILPGLVKRRAADRALFMGVPA